MEIIVTIVCLLVLLMILGGVSRAVWNAKPEGGGGTLLWVVAMLAACAFAFVSFAAGASFVEGSTGAMQGVLLVIFVFIAIVSRSAWVAVSTR
jgi:hypothetical protein